MVVQTGAFHSGACSVRGDGRTDGIGLQLEEADVAEIRDRWILNAHTSWAKERKIAFKVDAPLLLTTWPALS